MPCTCKQKVDRGQPKIQCSKCKELFHLKCVNLSEADADFFVKFERDFLCAVCTKLRRNSICSPPPPRNTPDALPPVDDPIVIVPEKQQGPSVPPVIQKVNNSQQKDREMESALIAVVQDLAGLRAENLHMPPVHANRGKLGAKPAYQDTAHLKTAERPKPIKACSAHQGAVA
ncbi:uncharacterized protein LOC128856488 [Anastrepha ludens]|uniref:uncharacterized protein LOC128856488 n=1 Tax=Anastrepha ludens TaxID=28586 RepID=UPI0023B0E5E4|nr:uncharacterized protein LOC128856488 [Anastrepha ludens]